MCVHEVKHDGYRLMVRRTPAGVRIRARNGCDWTDRFPLIVEAASKLNAASFVIDGEGVILRADGVSDFDRLHDLLINPWRPVQIIFAGKAHPEDGPGKEVLQQVYAFTRDPRLQGRVAFIEDYEIHLAHRLVQGVDLWLNLPRVPYEACGTSGMKAGLNAVPQLSTLDGWWAEGYMGQNGWAIPLAQPGDDADRSDAEHLFDLLEQEIVPLYYKRDARSLPVEWLQRMKHALRISGERFTARRMVQDYANYYYAPACRGEPADSAPPD